MQVAIAARDIGQCCRVFHLRQFLRAERVM
jgi:hypothetical protein